MRYTNPMTSKPKPFASDFARKRFHRALTHKPKPQTLTPQEHYNTYIKMYRECLASGSYLSQEEFMEYQLALSREKAGVVKKK